MKIFLDTADREAIKYWLPTGLVDGITTNPTLLSKQGSDVKKILTDICLLVPGDVSIEVVEKSPEAVYKQAKEIASLAKNVVVKIPFAHEYLPVIHTLAKEGVSLNITLVFSLLQALLVSKLGVKYISPFIGRWDDIDSDGIALLEELVHLKQVHNFSSMILAASIRGLMHWHHAALLGADVITLPPEILAKAMHHPLTEQGIVRFDADWKTVGKANLLQ
jgi:transaldolase